MKNVHRKEPRPEESNISMGDTQEDNFKRTLRQAGVKGGLEDLIADVFFRRDSTDLIYLDKIMTQVGIPPNRRGMIITSWSGSQGIPMPEELKIEAEKTQGIKEEEKGNAPMFDLGEARKQLKTMFEMQQYKAMMDFFGSFSHGQQGPQVPMLNVGPPSPNRIPYIDPKTNEIKYIESQGVDPTMMMMLMMMQGQNKSDLPTELLKFQELRKALVPEGQSDSKINELKTDIIKQQAEWDKKTLEEKGKFEKWMMEFKNVLERSKLETEFNEKLNKIDQQLRDAQGKGDMVQEMQRFGELKKLLFSFAESEGMKKGAEEGGPKINWNEMLNRGFESMNKYFEAQANRPVMMQSVHEIPVNPNVPQTPEDFQRTLSAQEQAKYPQSYENNFGGVTYHGEPLYSPGQSDINPPQQGNLDANVRPRGSPGPKPGDEQK